MLRIKLSDVFRATLDESSGNEGYLGFAPDGTAYHVVVPVDRQISRGLMFWVVPEDQTPFGGYKNWHYFRCPTYSGEENPERDRDTRLKRAREVASLIRKWAFGFGVEVEVIDDLEGGKE